VATADGDDDEIDDEAARHRIVEELIHPDRLVHRVEHAVEDRVVPAWRRHTDGEHRAAVTIAMLVAIALIVALPARVANRPRVLVPVLALVLLIALIIVAPARVRKPSAGIRALSLSLIGLMTVANAASAGRLVVDLARGQGIRQPAELLETGGAIWLTNIVLFALWYWEWDRGGPAERAMGHKPHPDFLFPQMQAPPDIARPDWESYFVDYLYLSFTNATAFSPTDVLPMSRWAKMLMMVQSMTSIITVGLVIARAVNVLK
jgi:hypothetical protein